MIAAVIMAGGCGTRFWPFSRQELPKQFLPIIDQRTMLQLTMSRLEGLIPVEQTFVVTTLQYQKLVFDNLPQLPGKNLIIEPQSRETAAGIGLAALKLFRMDPETIMVVLASDHFVEDLEAFHSDLRTATGLAREQDLLVTLGIKPSRPETAYGYICFDPDQRTALPGFAVRRFIEKPDREKALEYLKSGCYLWNSGIFIWKARVILEEIKEHLPQLYAALIELPVIPSAEEHCSETARLYAEIDPISIDYGVMEKTRHSWVFPANFVWDDLGSWQALSRVFQCNPQGNYIRGAHLGIDTQDCIIISRSNQLITTIGLENMIIVAADDAILICPRGKDQSVKELLQQLVSSRYREKLI